MHIAQISHMFLDGGGREEHIFQISKWLVKKGHKVTIITSDYTPTGEYIYKKKVDRIPEIKLVTLKGYLTKIPPGRVQIPDLLDFLLEYDVDIIHAHGMGEQPAEDAFYVAKIRNIPFVYTLHFAPYQVYEKLGKGISNIWKVFQQYQTYNLLRGADKIIAVSPPEKKDIIKYTKYPGNNFEVIPNGFEPPPEKITSIIIKETYQKFNIPEGRKYVVFMGALTNPRKGAFEAIQAFRMVKQKIPNLHLILIGTWDTRLTLAVKSNTTVKILEKLAKANHVTVTGWISEKEKFALLSGADVFISPTSYEAFGIAICEALYSKLPVITTDIGGGKYLIRKNIEGILIKDSTDIVSFAKALENLIKNPEKSKLMGEAGHHRVKKLFSWEKTTNRLEKIYFKLTNKSHQ